MEYVSKARLKEILKESKDHNFTISSDARDGAISAIETLIAIECKELPDQQWQTIDEFKVNTVEGWCWIYAQGSVDHAWYYSDNFWLRDNSGTAYFDVTHVMPIKTPEAPK